MTHVPLQNALSFLFSNPFSSKVPSVFVFFLIFDIHLISLSAIQQ